MRRRRLLFVATEDWFIRSHFSGLLSRAQEEGFDVSVGARMSGALDAFTGVRAIDTRAVRGALGPYALVRDLLAMRALLQREAPDVVHVFGLKPILLALASGGAADAGRVLAVTGRGYLGARPGARTRIVLSVLRRIIRAGLASPRAVLAVENTADRAWIEGGRAFDATNLTAQDIVESGGNVRFLRRLLFSWRAAAHAHLGQMAEARRHADDFARNIAALWRGPKDATLKDYGRWFVRCIPFKRKIERDIMETGLRAAGLHD